MSVARLHRSQWTVWRMLLNSSSFPYSTTTKEPETPLTKHLKTKILMGGGPLTVSQFMREALTNPKFGYYMNRDVFGEKGDFVTSPEVSQVFGELLGIWSVLTWQQLGQPKPFKLIELGPGRGTLMADLLRGTQRFKPFLTALESVNLVELSPHLKLKQAETLQCDPLSNSGTTSGITGTQIAWYGTIDEIEKTCPELILGHEFLDALPVHQFVKTSYGWREKLIDIAPDHDPLHFHFVLAPGVTPASAILPYKRLSWITSHEQINIKELEIGSEMLSFGILISQRIEQVNGAALFIDYGKDNYYPSSLQGVKKHKIVHALESPGEADISVHVDFSAFKQSTIESGSSVCTHGPIEQRYLLKSLGIDARMEHLVENASDAQFNELKSGYERLIGSEETGQKHGMGKLYKALAITARTCPTPTGF
eukprot:g836.t1